MKKFKTFTRKYLCLPYGIFMFVFIVMPLIILLLYAFSVKDGTGGLSFEFTFDNFASVFKSDNLAMLGAAHRTYHYADMPYYRISSSLSARR